LLSTASCTPASTYQISVNSEHPWQIHNVISVFEMTTTASQIYFQFRTWWRQSFKTK